MTIGILLLAYGSPSSAEEVRPYLQDIRGGREPSDDAVKELTERYEASGWSPLLKITMDQAEAVEEAIKVHGSFAVYVGMKHWAPRIPETIAAMKKDGVDRVIGMVLAPHYSKLSVGDYEKRVKAAIDSNKWDIPFTMVKSWHNSRKFVAFSAENLIRAAKNWDLKDPETRVFFSAHSLPEKILSEGDPYVEQLNESASLIAEKAGADHWEFAFQSASHTGIPWLGPDILDRLKSFRDDGGQRALVSPIGFVSDHLEILYDVDVECRQLADEMGLELRRTESPNTQAGFIQTVVDTLLTA